jgi:hypothetical protein
VRRVTARQIVFVLFAAALAAACAGEKPFLLQGDAYSAQVGFSRDLEGATRVAKQHCAQYERVPRFLEAQEDVAFFVCVLP